MNEHVVTEERLIEIFEGNFQRLKMENGHSLSEDVKEAAKQQVLMYWRKLKEIAMSVTDTEVPLNLPNLTTEKGRKYSIEGVVDIVKESDKVTMYDIKTHEADYVRENIELYQPQLNIYSYIWEKLKGEVVTQTAIIATQLPRKLSEAILIKNTDSIDTESMRWDPLVKVEHSISDIDKTISSFSSVVDLIEDHKFQSPKKERLGYRDGKKNTFATDVCRNCDARFSCQSYREYAKENKSQNWKKFADFYDFEPEGLDREERLESYTTTENSIENMLDDIS